MEKRGTPHHIVSKQLRNLLKPSEHSFMVKVMSELPIGRFLKRVTPRVHDFITDPYGRLWGGWRYPKEEPKEEETRLQEEVPLRHPVLAGSRDIAVDLGLIEVYKPPPKVYPPIPPEKRKVIMPALPEPRPIVTTVGVPLVERVPEIQIEL